MNTINDYLTLYLESLGDILDSNKIELILCDEYITQENLNSIWLSLENHLVYNKLSMTLEGYSIYRIEELGTAMFNYILYLNNLLEPVGCTKLNKTYSTTLDEFTTVTNIILNIKINTSNPIEQLLEVDFSINNINSKNELGENDYNYSITSKVNSKLEQLDNYIRYTNRTNDLLDDTMSILTDSGVINYNLFYKFNLFSKFKALIKLGNQVYLGLIFEFSYYLGKPILFMYNNDSSWYSLIDLFNVNAFGCPKTIVTKKLCIDNYLDIYPNSYFAQNYLVLNANKVINLIDNTILNYKNAILVDSLDIENKRPGILAADSITHVHEIYPPTNEYYFYRIVDNWSVYLGKSLKTPEYWVSSFGSFLGTVKEKTKLLSNRVFLSLENEVNDNSDNFKYTTVYCTFPNNTLKSNSYCERSYTLLSSIPNCPRKIYTGPNSSAVYYNKYIFTYNNTEGLKNNLFFDGFRRNPITNYDIPLIIGAFNGLIFYLDNNNYINYL